MDTYTLTLTESDFIAMSDTSRQWLREEREREGTRDEQQTKGPLVGSIGQVKFGGTRRPRQGAAAGHRPCRRRQRTLARITRYFWNGKRNLLN